jgi:AcrR family transcriptional regulator
MVHDGAVRADAQRNRTRIMGAARELVAETGVDATMEDIARRAGVAVGTLYRHFPAKEDLVAAVVDDSVDQIAVLTEEGLAAVRAGAPAGPELARLFRVIAQRHTTDRVLKAAAGRLDDHADLDAAPPGSAAARAVSAITELLGRAKEVGAIRADLTVADLGLLLSSTPGTEVPEEMRARFVDIVIAGLVAGPDA